MSIEGLTVVNQHLVSWMIRLNLVVWIYWIISFTLHLYFPYSYTFFMQRYCFCRHTEGHSYQSLSCIWPIKFYQGSATVSWYWSLMLQYYVHLVLLPGCHIFSCSITHVSPRSTDLQAGCPRSFDRREVGKSTFGNMDHSVRTGLYILTYF